MSIALATLWGCAGRAERGRPATQPAARSPGVYHTVERGQTLWRISQVYQIPLERLIQINAIDDPDRLEIGTRIWIPGASELRVVPVVGSDAGMARFLWPVPGGRLISGFGVQRASHRHSGLDIAAAAGDPVQASDDGTVRYAGSSLRGYGKTLIIDHGDGWSTLYAHNSALIAREGQLVRRGELIARIGRSGNATTEHCHFEIRRDGKAVDPLAYLAPAVANTTDGRP
jgi:LysM repeat protein